MGDLDDLYQEVILDHNRKPRNFREIPDATAEATGHNRLCGDKLHLQVKLEADQLVDIAFQGSGCAIFKASASMMTEALKGHTRDEAETLYRAFHAMVTEGAHPRRVHRQAGRLLRGLRVPGPGEVREPRLAHPHGRPGGQEEGAGQHRVADGT